MSMRKLTTFFHVVRHSLFPANDYYIRLKKDTRFLFSLKYFIALIVLLSVVLTLIYPTRFLPIYQPQKLKSVITETLNQFPEELIVTINEFGILTTNYQRPLIVFTLNERAPEKLLVIDPLATDDMIEEYDAYLLLMRRKAVVKSFEGAVMLEYRTQQPLTMNKQSVDNLSSLLTEIVNNYWLFFGLFMFVALIILPLIFVASKLAYVALASLLVFLVVRLFFVKQLTYKKAIQIGFHASTAPILLEYSSMIFNLSIPVKIWFFVLTIVFISAGIYEAYSVASKRDN